MRRIVERAILLICCLQLPRVKMTELRRVQISLLDATGDKGGINYGGQNRLKANNGHRCFHASFTAIKSWRDAGRRL